MLASVTITLNPAIDRTVLIPGFTAGATNRVESMHSHAGGKGINVASALSDLGHRVAVSGFLGHDNTAIFERLFIAKKLEDRFVRIPGSTRQCIKISHSEQSEITEVNFPGLTPSPNDIEFFQAMVGALDAQWFVLSGSIPEGVSADIYQHLIRTLRARNKKILLDTSGEPFALALEAVPHIIKPNLHELSTFVGKPLKTDAEILEATHPLLDLGIELIIVSLGAEGALFITKTQTLKATPPQVNVRSTVGAGDAMVAGIISAQLQNLDLETTARLATACSLDAIQQLGPGLNSRQSVDQYRDQVTIIHHH
ncbi:1-phosphofructokinase [Phragmitibacter flavus]|uniref:1-phosphofructokinase n=1 Tax=Phragmitibacter flavus TaxID=2576071 RepID=A0A5R8KGG0_9BACT|nr:1-phosphofructokinase [Phragmitibacter flavus]TLD71384.1 1-phosphofructokinase [Phragmitibacter flavus]